MYSIPKHCGFILLLLQTVKQMSFFLPQQHSKPHTLHCCIEDDQSSRVFKITFGVNTKCIEMWISYSDFVVYYFIVYWFSCSVYQHNSHFSQLTLLYRKCNMFYCISLVFCFTCKKVRMPPCGANSPCLVQEFYNPSLRCSVWYWCHLYQE